MIADVIPGPSTTAVVRVLMVEDNAADARLVTEYLLEVEPRRFVVTNVQHLRQARETLRLDPFDVIILDLGLPDSQGLDTLRNIRAEAARTPIIVLTGLDDEATGIEAVTSGAQDYLVKRASTGHLLRHSVVFAIERARAEAIIRDRDERYRLITETSFDGFAISEDGIIQEVNNGYARIFGYTPEEMIGMRLDAVVAAEGIAEAREIMQVDSYDRREVLCKHRDGRSVRIEATVNSYSSAGRLRRVSAIRDITERYNLQRQYLQAQKMEAIGRLAGGVAHDFNNLLTVISSYASLLLSEEGLSFAMRDDIGQIEKASAAAATLTRQLLAFSRQQVIQPVSLDLNDVVRDAQKILRRVIGEDVALVVKLDESLGRVLADFGQIEQVIMNMAVNARDAMPGGGRLTIETSNADLAEAYTRDGFEAAAGPYVVLAIGDSGTGMSEETKLRIFEPFFTTKESGKGTGLGLSMVFGIVKQSGGYVVVESSESAGTIFHIHLPRVDTPADAPSPSASGGVLRGTETVLLVEDVSALREIVRRVLGEKGYNVLDAVDGPAALLIAEKYRDPIHLLIADVVLPGMSGHELARALQPTRSGLKVLFTSGYTDDAVLRRGVFERDVAFLQKPFTPDVLARRVREVLDGTIPNP